MDRNICYLDTIYIVLGRFLDRSNNYLHSDISSYVLALPVSDYRKLAKIDVKKLRSENIKTTKSSSVNQIFE
jgi:hypothetical protein